jgi:hypothetical protein
MVDMPGVGPVQNPPPAQTDPPGGAVGPATDDSAFSLLGGISAAVGDYFDGKPIGDIIGGIVDDTDTHIDDAILDITTGVIDVWDDPPAPPPKGIKKILGDRIKDSMTDQINDIKDNILEGDLAGASGAAEDLADWYLDKPELIQDGIIGGIKDQLHDLLDNITGLFGSGETGAAGTEGPPPPEEPETP